MKCVVCGGEGPFEMEACIIDESRPICDRCANAIDTLSETAGPAEAWGSSYQWIAENSERIQDKPVSDFIGDTLFAAQESPQYAKFQLAQREAAERERLAQLEATERERDKMAAPYNPIYEYAVEAIRDHLDGSTDTEMISATISSYAARGWRLHKTMVKEIGKESHSHDLGGFVEEANATIEETILIFERMLTPPGKR